MRCFTRLANGFSKKLENYTAAIVALHCTHYNFARPYKALSIRRETGRPIKRTPAMASPFAEHIWTCQEIAELSN